MTAEDTLAPAAPIESKDDLIRYMETGARPANEWRIGTEHEKFGFTLEDKKPLTYDGPRGVRAMLEGLMEFGWKPVYEGENPIALELNGQSITLEPGGQFELSGAPLETLHQTCDEVHTHLHQVKTVAEKLGIGFLGIGFHPLARRDEIPVMPKGRYGIMRRYMPTKGRLGLDMMFRTCTVQVNLDFDSEADMVRKFRVGLALQPVATALFANSPFTEGKPNGYLSYRSKVWTDTDPDRCGMLPFVFEEGMGYERYVDYVLDVPMYFVYRDGTYIDAAGQSFRDFMAGRLPALPGEVPSIRDWEDHLSTVFPEVRLKRFLEMRGADGGPWRRLCALPALWVGLLYDGVSLDACEALISDWTTAEREALRRDVPKLGLKTPFRGSTVQALARDVLAIARDGLQRRNRLNSLGENETHFLSALEAIVDEGKCPAEVNLEAYHGRWGESVLPLFDEFAY
ncbi:MAG: glutamate--cysteine ligase [Alphaproteobacteria bacterium]|nr:MAG: glutamate--cysteine ligase [Alphaproteobacteria bacterium]